MQDTPFHHECQQRAVLSITMSVNRGQSYAGHSVQWGGACYIQLHACTRSRYCAHTSLLLLTHHSHPGRQCCIFVTTPSLSNRPVYWAHTCGKFGLLSGGHLCSHRDTSTGPNNYTHTSVLMYTHHSHPGKHSHIFSHHPFPFSRPVLYVQGHALVVKIGLLFWGPLVHIQGHLHWSQQLHPHISADVHTSHTHPGKHSHIFFTPPLPFQQACLVRTRARTGSKDRSAFLGATCAHTGTPALVPTTTPTHQC